MVVMAFFSRDDIATFLPSYKKLGILKEDPFETVDTEGVGELVKEGVRRGRLAKSHLKV